MKVNIHTRKGHTQTKWIKAFRDGLKRHGEDAEVVLGNNPGRGCDLAVHWSHRYPVVDRKQRESGNDYLVLECGFIDRLDWCSTGFNGLHGRAEHVTPDGETHRWGRYFGDRLKDWRPMVNGTVLLCGQIPGDAALNGLNMPEWLNDTKRRLEAKGYAVRVRPHPRCDASVRPILADLDDVWFAVTFNSTAGIDCVVNGIPVVALDEGSMAWDVAGHSLDPPPMPNRKKWAEWLSWCQWSLDEFRSGEAWALLKTRYE